MEGEALQVTEARSHGLLPDFETGVPVRGCYCLEYDRSSSSLEQVASTSFLLSRDHAHPPSPGPPFCSPFARIDSGALGRGLQRRVELPGPVGGFQRLPPQTGRTRGGARAEAV